MIGYYIYKIKVVEGLGSFLSGCLIQLVKYTTHNHCLFSLSATRVTTLWLKQPLILFLLCTHFRKPSGHTGSILLHIRKGK